MAIKDRKTKDTFLDTETISPHALATEIYLAVNTYWESLRFELPRLNETRSWHRIVDTMRENLHDICNKGEEAYLQDQTFYELGSRSAVVLLGRSALASSMFSKNM